MANVHKGDVPFEVNGTRYVLSYSADAIAQLEDMLDMSYGDLAVLMQDKSKFRVSILRKMIFAGLLDHQPDIKEDDVRAILRSMNMMSAMRLFSEAMSDQADEVKPNPQPESASGAAPNGAGS